MSLRGHGSVVGVGVVGLAVLAALPFSLVSLGQDYQHGAALGELALVPVCALGLAVVAAVRHPWVTQLRAGRADYARGDGAWPSLQSCWCGDR